MAARPKRGAKGGESSKVAKEKKLGCPDAEKVEEAPEVSGRGRRQASAATKAWASLIPRSRSNSQGRVEEEAKAKPKGKTGNATPSTNPAERQQEKGKGRGRKDNKTPTTSTADKTGKRKAKLDTNLSTPASSELASDGGNQNKSDEEKGRGRRGRATPATTPKTDQNNKTQAAKTGKVAKEVKDKVDEINRNESEVGGESDIKTRRGKLSSEKASSPGPSKRKGGETSKGGKKSGSVVTKIMEGTEAQKSGRRSTSRARVGKAVESDSKKTTKKPDQTTKKSAESLPKIDSYFTKASEKSLNSKANVGENPRKRKSEDDDSEDPTPAKKATQQLLQKSKKTPPKKSLAHRDILNLLDDFNGDDKEEEKNSDEETEVSFKTDTSATTSKSWISSVPDLSVPRKKVTAEAYITRIKSQVPVWHRETSASAAIRRKSFLYGDLQPKVKEDVFNPDNYGEEEFGPDDPKAKVKKTRKKKKVTKAIVVFGGAEEAAEAKKSVKASHNLKTPGEAGKKTRKRVVHHQPPPAAPPAAAAVLPKPLTADRLISAPGSSEALMASSDFNTEQPESLEDYSDYSHGAQNFFDSQQEGAIADRGEERRSGAFGASTTQPSLLEVPNMKSYHTPSVPRKHARLQTQSVSTPNPKESVPVSIKEQIKTNFGFTDSEDEEGGSENESLAISPVRNHPGLALYQDLSVLSESTTSRLSMAPPCLPSSRAAAPVQRTAGPFRFNVSPLKKGKVVSERANLLAQVEALRKEKFDATKGSRQKKLSKKRPPAALEQSSLYEDVVEPNLPKIDDMMARVAEKRRGEQEEGLKNRESSDKENSQSESDNSESPRKKASVKGSNESKVGEKIKKVVGRTYGKKGLVLRGNKEDEGEEEEGMSKKKMLTQNTISKKPPAATKKEKERKKWEGNVTSHFSEVEEFDLSFS